MYIYFIFFGGLLAGWYLFIDRVVLKWSVELQIFWLLFSQLGREGLTKVNTAVFDPWGQAGGKLIARIENASEIELGLMTTTSCRMESREQFCSALGMHLGLPHRVPMPADCNWYSYS